MYLFAPLRVQRTKLRHQENFIAPASDSIADRLLREAQSIHLRCVDVVHSEVEAFAQGGDQNCLVFRAVEPGALTDNRDLAPRRAKASLFHSCLAARVRKGP